MNSHILYDPILSLSLVIRQRFDLAASQAISILVASFINDARSVVLDHR